MMTLIEVLGLAWVVLALLHHVVPVTALVVYSKCLANYASFPRFRTFFRADHLLQGTLPDFFMQAAAASYSFIRMLLECVI